MDRCENMKKVTVLKDCDGMLYVYEKPCIMTEEDAQRCKDWYYEELGNEYVVRIEEV